MKTVQSSDGTLTDTQTITVNVNGSGPTISGDSKDNVLTGTAGNDTLNGFAGNDQLQPSSGAIKVLVAASTTLITAVNASVSLIRIGN